MNSRATASASSFAEGRLLAGFNIHVAAMGIPPFVYDSRQQTRSKPELESAMWRELRFAARNLRKARGFSAACVLTLAVGVGATTALFSVVYGILLRPLPYPEPDSLVRITAERTIAGKVYGASFSAPEFPEWARRASALQLAAFAGNGFALFDEDGTTNLLGAYVTPEFFQIVGPPMLAIAGVGVGIVVALGVTRGLRSVLYGVTPDDPVLFATAAAALFAVAVMASSSGHRRRRVSKAAPGHPPIDLSGWPSRIGVSRRCADVRYRNLQRLELSRARQSDGLSRCNGAVRPNQ